MPRFSVKRTIQIQSTPQEVFRVLRDFKRWPEWSPWLIAEPDCSLVFSEDGKRYGWDGKIIGSGEMEIRGEESGRSIDYELRFLKPWKSTSAVRFELAEKDGGTDVTWTMDGSLPVFMFWMKSMMTNFIGMDYERGLAMLKDLLETGSVPSSLEFIGEQPMPGFAYVGIQSECAMKDIAASMGADFDRLTQWLEKHKVCPSAAPFSIYHKWDLAKQSTRYTIGFPVAEFPETGEDGVITGQRPASRVYAIRHIGAYRHLGNAWSAGFIRARSKFFAQDKKLDPMETYENDPRETAEPDLVTVVQFPAK